MVEERQRSANADVVLEALANERRRHVLYCLCEHETPISIGDLAREIAARKREGGESDVPENETDRTRVLLYHSHLPKLADAGLVDYDRERKLVDAAAPVDLESLLESDPF